MNRTGLRFFAFLMFIICSANFFVSCAPVDAVVNFFADDGTGHIFKYAIKSDPECLDPQLANDESAVMIAKNLFAGLMDYDENGRLVGRIAKDYVISNDGLTYTFYLDEGYMWCATGGFEAPVTAHDFVFGFRRLMDPKTASPHSKKYFCISGAEEARRGDIGTEQIGVKALDDYTVEFMLDYPNAEFLYLLAELPAMPCCEEFFNTSGGKYGLEAEATCSNGPFYIRYWLHDPYGTNNYVRLRRNSGYSEKSYVSPAGVNYLITPNYNERKTDFANGSTEAMLYVGGQKADADDKHILGYADTCGLVFNEKIKTFSDPEIRQIFSLAIDRELLSKNSSKMLLPAYSIVPDSPVLSAKGYNSRVEDEATSSNPAMAEYRWSFIMSESEKSELIGMTVMVPSSFEYNELLNDLTDCWYEVMKIHFRMEIVNDRDYAQRIKSGDYDIALVNLSSDTASPLDFLRPFGSAKTYGFELPDVRNAESEEGRYVTLASMNYACSVAEKAILSEYHFIPIWHLPTVCCFDDDVEELALDPFKKTVYFENAKKF